MHYTSIFFQGPVIGHLGTEKLKMSLMHQLHYICQSVLSCVYHICLLHCNYKITECTQFSIACRYCVFASHHFILNIQLIQTNRHLTDNIFSYLLACIVCSNTNVQQLQMVKATQPTYRVCLCSTQFCYYQSFNAGPLKIIIKIQLTPPDGLWTLFVCKKIN